MNKKIRPVILCGGAGSRLWPLSRTERPKPFVELTGKDTLFDETLMRIRDTNIFEEPIVVCNEIHLQLIESSQRKQSVNVSKIILEPVGRNTAAAVALASLVSFPDELLLFLPADHCIDDVLNFQKGVLNAASAAEEGYLATFGIKPTRAETGYGYIEKGKEILGLNGVSCIKKFKEKPNKQLAEEFLKTDHFFWNSGMFLFRADIILGEFEKYELGIIEKLGDIVKPLSDNRVIRLPKKEFEAINSISIDYAIMEKTSKAVVVEVDFDWDDLGDYKAIKRHALKRQKKHSNENVVDGDSLIINAEGNYVKTEKTKVVIAGVDNLAVVETGDTVLIADINKSHDMKEVYQQLNEQNEVRVHTPVKTIRPWGNFESISKQEGYQLKCIEVNSGGQLSLQKHQHRSEHWIVLSGIATVTVGTEVKELNPGEHIYIPLGEVHRLENFGSDPVKIIELQLGNYLGEDDIVRLEDVYQRV